MTLYALRVHTAVMASTPHTTVRLPAADREWLKQHAQASGLSQSSLLRLALKRLKADPPMPETE